MRTVLSFLLAAAPLAAQFSGLATDDAGSRVWFSSALQLQGATENPTAKILVADSQGHVQLAVQSAAGDPYSILTSPEVSGDGSVITWRATYNCPPQIVCKVADYVMSTVSGKGAPLVDTGYFHLSRNGRYVARENYNFSGPTGQFQIIDLTSSQRQSIPVADLQALTGGGRQVTSAGAVLAYANGQLWLFQPNGSAQGVPTANFEVPAPGPFFSVAANAAVDDAGVRVVYQGVLSACEIDLTGPSATLPTALLSANQACTLESLSADGSTALVVSAANLDGSNSSGLAQAWALDTASKAVQAVTTDPAGIAEATLSGDGHVVWAVTLAGRILRIDRTSGQVQEIVPQTTAVDQDILSFPLMAAPGAVVSLTGRGLASQPGATGIQVLADGQALPVISVAPSAILFQVPWDMQGTHTLTVAGTSSPFQEVLSRGLQIRPSAPVFLYTAAGYPVIAHQDFHGLVSQSDPAVVDEIIHLYITGLGAVVPPVATGQPAPSSPLSMMVDPVHVFWQGSLPVNFPVAAKVIFAGLAPGLVGVEQIDVQVPHEAPTELGVSVSTTAGNAAATFAVRPY